MTSFLEHGIDDYEENGSTIGLGPSGLGPTGEVYLA